MFVTNLLEHLAADAAPGPSAAARAGAELGPGPVRDLTCHRHPQRIHPTAEDLHRRGHLQQAVVVKATHRRTPQGLPEPRREGVQLGNRPRRSGRARGGIRCRVFQEVGHKQEFT